jgi:hypothetical protein
VSISYRNKRAILPISRSNANYLPFNGENLDGWTVDVPEMDQDPKVKSPFVLRDGLLVSLGTPGGHLITDSRSSTGLPPNPETVGSWFMLLPPGLFTACFPDLLRCS